MSRDDSRDIAVDAIGALKVVNNYILGCVPVGQQQEGQLYEARDRIIAAINCLVFYVDSRDAMTKE